MYRLLLGFTQIITSSLIIYLSPFTFENIGDLGLSNLLIIPVLIFSFTAFINFINFMDGIDGLVGSCFLIGFLFMAFQNDPLIFIFVGTIAGFLNGIGILQRFLWEMLAALFWQLIF